MKGKQLAILLVLAVALGGAWYFLSNRGQDSWSSSAGSAGGKVTEFPINDVVHVVIKDATSEVNLIKKSDVWTVKERDYPANFEQIGTLLRQIWELKAVQDVKVGPSQLARLELVEPGNGEKTGTVVQFLGAENKRLGGLLLGKKHMRNNEGGVDFAPTGEGFPIGRYVKPLTDSKVSLVSEVFGDVEPRPDHWLSKDFFKVNSPKAIKVKGVTDANTWSVSRESATGDWKLTDAKGDEKLDTSKVSALGTILISPSFNDVEAPDAKLEEPITMATIETFEGITYELQIGKSTGDTQLIKLSVSGNFPKERTPGKDEKPEDKTRLDGEFALKTKELQDKLASEKKLEGRIYKVSKFTIEPLLKARKEILEEKPAETPKPAESSAPAPAPAPGNATPATPAPAATATTAPVAAPTPTPTPKPASKPTSTPAASAPASPAAPKAPASPAPAAPANSSTPAPAKPSATPAPAAKAPAASPAPSPATPAPEEAPKPAGAN